MSRSGLAVLKLIIHGPISRNCKIEEEAPQAKSDEDALWLWNESAKWTKLEEAKELE